MNVAPPYADTRAGKSQMLPIPTADPMQARINPRFDLNPSLLAPPPAEPPARVAAGSTVLSVTDAPVLVSSSGLELPRALTQVATALPLSA